MQVHFYIIETTIDITRPINLAPMSLSFDLSHDSVMDLNFYTCLKHHILIYYDAPVNRKIVVSLSNLYVIHIYYFQLLRVALMKYQ